MADFDVLLSRPGSINNSYATEADATALFLKVFSGEVLDTFDEFNVMEKLVMVRRIPFGKEAQFPVLGRAAAAGLLPDATANLTNIFLDAAYANRIKQNERLISVDGPILAPVSLAEIDEIREHFDVRSMYAQELGRAVAEEYDRRALIMGFKGARAASNITAGGPDADKPGTALTDADFESNGASAVATLFQAMQTLDEKHVPRMGRHAIITPQTYANLVQQTDLLNRDWNSRANGEFADGTVLKVAGFQLHVSTRVNTLGNIAGNLLGAVNDYTGDFSTSVALLLHESGVGALSSVDMQVESEYKIEYQSHCMVAKKICGLNYLRPEALIEVKTA